MTNIELITILMNPKDKLIAIDLDGVLCNGDFWKDEDPTPIATGIDMVWKLYVKGAHVIIYTARQPKYYPQTHAWLIKNNVPFHGIAMTMKPAAAVYIDDRALNSTFDYNIYEELSK